MSATPLGSCATTNQPPAEARLQGLRVLMLDNEPDTLDALCTVLTMAGATVESFHDPAAALAGVEAFGPHVLVCDLYMPGMDGWSFMEQVRARGLTIPAVALTAHPSAANQERALACGYAACLGKPIHPEEFVGVLRTMAQAQRGPMPGAADLEGVSVYRPGR